MGGWMGARASSTWGGQSASQRRRRHAARAAASLHGAVHAPLSAAAAAAASVYGMRSSAPLLRNNPPRPSTAQGCSSWGDGQGRAHLSDLSVRDTGSGRFVREPLVRPPHWRRQGCSGRQQPGSRQLVLVPSVMGLAPRLLAVNPPAAARQGDPAPRRPLDVRVVLVPEPHLAPALAVCRVRSGRPVAISPSWTQGAKRLHASTGVLHAKQRPPLPPPPCSLVECQEAAGRHDVQVLGAEPRAFVPLQRERAAAAARTSGCCASLARHSWAGPGQPWLPTRCGPTP